jgi:hypothetical protein
MAGIALAFAASTWALPEAQLPVPSAAKQGSDTAILLHAGVIEPDLNKAPASLSNSRYALVQFDSRKVLSIKPLTDVGVEVVDYIPHNTYVVRLNGVSGKSIRAIDGVRYAAPFLPEYKVSPVVEHEAALANNRLRVLGFRGISEAKLVSTIRKLVPQAHFMTSAELGGQAHV